MQYTYTYILLAYCYCLRAIYLNTIVLFKLQHTFFFFSKTQFLIHLTVTSENVKRQVNNFKCRDAFCFWGKNHFQSENYGHCKKWGKCHHAIGFKFVGHAPYWGLLFVLFFAILCKISKAKKKIRCWLAVTLQTIINRC